MFKIFCVIILTIFLNFNASIVFSQDDTVKPIKTLGKNYPLVGINEVLLYNGIVVVLTSTFPSIHIFSGKEFEQYRAFGERGSGPMELQMPASVDILEDTLFVLDSRPNICKIISYTILGEYISSEPIRGRGFCNNLTVTKDYKIVATNEVFSDIRKILLLKGKEINSIIDLAKGEEVKLQIPGGPMQTYTYSNPFLARPVWRLNKNTNEIILWYGKEDTLSSIDVFSGIKKTYLIISANKIIIDKGDVHNWVEKEYASEKPMFGYDDFLRNVRKEIIQKIVIPRYYPLLNRIEIGHNGDIWIQRAFSRSKGQVWSIFDSEDKKEQKVVFPPERKLMALGEEIIALYMEEQKGIEYIEIYKKSDFINQ